MQLVTFSQLLETIAKVTTYYKTSLFAFNLADLRMPVLNKYSRSTDHRYWSLAHSRADISNKVKPDDSVYSYQVCLLILGWTCIESLTVTPRRCWRRACQSQSEAATTAPARTAIKFCSLLRAVCFSIPNNRLNIFSVFTCAVVLRNKKASSSVRHSFELQNRCLRVSL